MCFDFRLCIFYSFAGGGTAVAGGGACPKTPFGERYTLFLLFIIASIANGAIRQERKVDESDTVARDRSDCDSVVPPVASDSFREDRRFEKTLAAFFERKDAGAVLFKEWGAYRDVPPEYSHGDDWEHLLRQGIALLEQFARDNRIQVRQPKRNTQKKIVRPLSNGNEFVAYVDAIGQLDGSRRLLEWKTTSARYPHQPEGLTALDLQLVCYSWITGISEVAIVAFVRKRVPEIQYLLASITDEQRQEFGHLVDATACQIEAAQFLAHPGIRFPQNGCVSCAHLGLGLGNESIVAAKLIRQPGAADLDWLDVLDD